MFSCYDVLPYCPLIPPSLTLSIPPPSLSHSPSLPPSLSHSPSLPPSLSLSSSLLLLQPTIDHRFDSYYNYCELFNLILSTFQHLPSIRSSPS